MKPTKTSGSLFVKFLDDPEFWPEGYCVDEEVILADGVKLPPAYGFAALSPAAVVEIHAGTVWNDTNNIEVAPLAAHFRRWKKRQTFETFVVEVSKEAAKELKELLEARGVKVVTA